MAVDRSLKPQSVLFLCAMNQVRSPMAAGLAKHYFGRVLYVDSAGVRKGEHDGFVDAVMDEIGIDMSKHRAKTLEELEEWDGLGFDLIVSLSPEAHHAALELTRTLAVGVEYWPIPDATRTEGSREQRLEAYRQVREMLSERILRRFSSSP